MSCPSENVLLDYVERRLGAVQFGMVSAHLERCDACRALLSNPTVQTWVGPYRLERAIGGGGMGVVYRAHHGDSGQVVALKVLRPELGQEPSLVKRFHREVEALGAVAHPNLVKVLDSGTTEKHEPWLAMELVEGLSLSRMIRERGAMSVPVVLSLARQLAQALQVAHANGLIHRDLKPGNLLISDAMHLTVLDFGLVKHIKRTDETAISFSVFLGTPGYMAPEQIRGEEPTPAVDLYSVGVILHEALAGRRLFTGPSGHAIVATQLERDAPRLDAPHVPAAVTELVASLLSRGVANRVRTAEELLARLAQLEAAPTAQTVVELESVRRGPGYSQTRLVVLGAALSSVLLIVGSLAFGSATSRGNVPTAPLTVATTPPPRLEPTAAPTAPDEPTTPAEAPAVIAAPTPSPPPPKNDPPTPIARAQRRPPPAKPASRAPVDEPAALTPPPASSTSERLLTLQREVARLRTTLTGDRVALGLLDRVASGLTAQASPEQLRAVETKLRDLERQYAP